MLQNEIIKAIEEKLSLFLGEMYNESYYFTVLKNKIGRFALSFLHTNHRDINEILLSILEECDIRQLKDNKYSSRIHLFLSQQGEYDEIIGNMEALRVSIEDEAELEKEDYIEIQETGIHLTEKFRELVRTLKDF